MVDWVNRLFQAIDARDADAFASFLTEDVRFRFGSSPPMSGRQAARAGVAGFFETLCGLSHRLARVWTETGAVICEGEVTYALPDGRSITLPFVNILTMCGTLICDYRVYVDLSPIKAAASVDRGSP